MIRIAGYQMGELRLREANGLVQDHQVNRSQTESVQLTQPWA